MTNLQRGGPKRTGMVERAGSSAVARLALFAGLDVLEEDGQERARASASGVACEGETADAWHTRFLASRVTEVGNGTMLFGVGGFLAPAATPPRKTATMNTISHDTCIDLFCSGNNAGHGYAPDGATISAAVDVLIEEGGTLIYASRTSDDVAVIEDSAGELVAIGGDWEGGNAWAVVIG